MIRGLSCRCFLEILIGCSGVGSASFRMEKLAGVGVTDLVMMTGVFWMTVLGGETS